MTRTTHTAVAAARSPAGLALAALALAALFALAAPLHAQIVRGQVVEQGSNTPVEGAMVVLLELDDRTVHRVLTDASGGFILDADHPGPHHIRVDRIGYESLVTATFPVPVEGTFQRVEVPIRPVELVGLEVEGSPRCEVRGDQGASTARAWEEARKALQAAAWTLESGVYRYTLLNFDRTLSDDGRTVLKEDRVFDRGSGQAPYVSAPAEKLMGEGFIVENDDGTLTYFAPDAASFLSDAFLDTHCMRLESVKDGEIGLAFEPVRGRRLPEIRGTLWIEAATAQLKRLDFTYVNLPPQRDMGNAGGQVVFGRLPNGTWVVREWSIRMPMLATNPQRTRLIVRGYQEQGGVVWRVIDRAGTTVVEASTATVSGTVVDSLGALPVAGATVRVSDGTAEAVTGEGGRFLLPGLAGGLQSLMVSHPALDTLGLGPVPFSVEAVMGEVASSRLRLPGVEETLFYACQDSPVRDEETAVVMGRVRLPGGSLEGTPVRVRWLGEDRAGFEVTARAAPRMGDAEPPLWRPDPDDARWVVTELDQRGIFVVCGVPTRTQIRLEVGPPDGTEVRTVTLPPGSRVVIVPFTLAALPTPSEPSRP